MNFIAASCFGAPAAPGLAATLNIAVEPAALKILTTKSASSPDGALTTSYQFSSKSH